MLFFNILLVSSQENIKEKNKKNTKKKEKQTEKKEGNVKYNKKLCNEGDCSTPQ